MTQAKSLHYQPQDYPYGHVACSILFHPEQNRWTADPLQVRCGNCERTEVYRQALIEQGRKARVGLVRDIVAKHITGKPVLAPWYERCGLPSYGKSTARFYLLMGENRR